MFDYDEKVYKRLQKKYGKYIGKYLVRFNHNTKKLQYYYKVISIDMYSINLVKSHRLIKYSPHPYPITRTRFDMMLKLPTLKLVDESEFEVIKALYL